MLAKLLARWITAKYFENATATVTLCIRIGEPQVRCPRCLQQGSHARAVALAAYWCLVALTALTFQASQSVFAQTSPPRPSECSIKYVLDNDHNYSTSAALYMTPQCEQLLRDQVLSETPPSLAGRYVLLKLQADNSNRAAEAVGALRALCEVEGYPRACSAIAILIDLKVIEGTDADLIHFSTLATEGKVPGGVNILAAYYFRRFLKTGEIPDLCKAFQLWRQGSELGDTHLAEIYRLAKEAYGASCVKP